MSTQVSTSHTVHRAHHPTPLKVIRRPPRSDVTHAIQTFLPYAVAFLLALVVYTSLRSSSTTEYPPYSPPNMLQEESLHTSSVDLAGVFNRRSERLEEMMRKAQSNEDVKAGHWATWRTKRSAELEAKKKTAEEQARERINTIPTRLADVFERAKSKGEEAVEEMRDVESNIQTFAYDAIYAWKQTAAEFKDTASERIESIKETPVMETVEEVVQSIKESPIMETVDEVVQGMRETAAEWSSEGVDALGEVVSAIEERVTQAVDTLRDRVMVNSSVTERSRCVCNDPTMCP